MNVRSATEADYEALMALLGQLDPTEPPPSPDIGGRLLARMLDGTGLDVLVAEVDGRIVSTCYLNVTPNLTRGGRPYALIENVVTDAAHRNRGLGRAVVEHAVEQARRAGCYKIMLMTSVEGEAILAFYRACGFSADDKRAFVHRGAQT